MSAGLQVILTVLYLVSLFATFYKKTHGAVPCLRPKFPPSKSLSTRLCGYISICVNVTNIVCKLITRLLLVKCNTLCSPRANGAAWRMLDKPRTRPLCLVICGVASSVWLWQCHLQQRMGTDVRGPTPEKAWVVCRLYSILSKDDFDY
jgi:hypothetical protein